MAVSSLTRMTVPLASDQSQSTQGLLMPKLKYRFRVTFDGFGTSNSASPTTELTKQVMDFNRPTVSFEEMAIPIYNSTIKLVGKHSWGDVTCNLRDVASGQVSTFLGTGDANTFGHADGNGAQALFNRPWSIVMAADRRATAGGIVVMKNAQKVISINDYFLP
jgi:hypothetical protein